MTMSRKARIGLGVAAILAGLIFTGWICTRPMPVHTASMDEITREIAKLKQGKAYRDGGLHLATVEATGKHFSPDSPANYYIGQHLFVDFAVTFTPEQFETMKKTGALPFASLNPDQKASLQRLCKYDTSPELKGADMAHSTFVFMYEPYYYYMSWRYTKANGSIQTSRYPLTDDSYGMVPVY